MVRRTGLEPATLKPGTSCSIQLSYQRWHFHLPYQKLRGAALTPLISTPLTRHQMPFKVVEANQTMAKGTVAHSAFNAQCLHHGGHGRVFLPLVLQRHFCAP
jgi:hypothetical protein